MLYTLVEVSIKGSMCTLGDNFADRGKVRPGNCSIGRLFSDPRFTEAILDFLRETDVGKVKKGVIVRGVAVE